VKSGITSTASRDTFKSVGSLDSSNFVKNQNITLSCIAHDGILVSSELNTTTTVLNSPSTISQIFLIQLNATDYLCNHTYIDVDNDPEITPQYEWYQNGLPTGTNTMNKAIADYNTSDQVFCQVTTGDGIGPNATAKGQLDAASAYPGKKDLQVCCADSRQSKGTVGTHPAWCYLERAQRNEQLPARGVHHERRQGDVAHRPRGRGSRQPARAQPVLPQALRTQPRRPVLQIWRADEQ
jgi:hypothetical protein